MKLLPSSFATILLLLVSSTVALAQGTPRHESDTMVWDGMPLTASCAENQITVNQCAFDVWRQADEEMNAVYREQIAYFDESQVKYKGDGKPKLRLIAAQRAWVTFRDRDCDYQVGEGGSSGTYERHKCMYKRTLRRTQELREYVECRYNGCPY